MGGKSSKGKNSAPKENSVAPAARGTSNGGGGGCGRGGMKLVECEQRKRRNDIDGFLALMNACHPRLGEKSPAQSLGPWMLQDIYDLLFRDAACIERRFVASADHYTVKDDAHTLVQKTDCINVIAVAEPKLERGTVAMWKLRVNDLASNGSMRYIGLHTEVGGYWSPHYNVNLQTGATMVNRTERPNGKVELCAEKGSVITVIANLTGEKGTLTFLINDTRVSEKEAEFDDILIKGDLWFAITLQREGDSVTQLF